MSKHFGLAISLLFTICNAAYPPELPKCKAEDYPCILKTGNYIVNMFASKGYPALSLPVIDPYHVSNIVVNRDSLSPINLNMQFKSAEVKGLQGQIYQRAAGFYKDPSKGKFELYGVAPSLEVNGDYKSDGRVLLLPVSGEGKFNLSTTNVKGSLKIKASVIEKDGLHFYKVDKVKVLLEPETLQIQLTNLFNGNKDLSDSFLEIVNKNWREAWPEIAPPLFDLTESAIKSIIQELFDKFPHEDLFLPD